MRFTQVFVFLFSILLSQSGFSNKVYMAYDSDCMDIYEYHYNGNTTGLGHIVYHIALNDMEKIVLEVGVEANSKQPIKPTKTVSCNGMSLNERTVRQINNGDMELYIVRKDGRGYNVSQVGIASYVQINGTSTGYSSLDSRFSYNFSQPANGINIATNGSDAQVFFKGIVSNTCPKKYLFNKTRQKGGRSYTEFVVIPEIGVIEEKNGFNQVDAQNSVLRLIKINSEPIERYLRNYCNDASAGQNKGFYVGGSFDNKGEFVGGKPSLADLESGKTNTTNTRPNTNNTNNSTNNNNNTDFNTDPTGKFSELTCSIYKDIDRGVYMDWKTGQVANGECGGNQYINGRMVGANTTSIVTTPTTSRPTTTSQPPPPPTSNNTAIFINSNCNDVSTYGTHVVQRDETLYGIARLYGLNLNQIRKFNPGLRGDVIYPCMKLLTKSQSGSPVVATDYNANQHNVQRGETLYQLATKYGYTVDRFRKLNGLGPTDIIYVGQVLKTQDCNCPATSSSDIAASSFVPSEFNAVSGRIDTEKGTNVTVNRRYHVVKEDDTVYSISKQYNVSVASLRQINDLEPNEIIIPYQRIYLQ